MRLRDTFTLLQNNLVPLGIRATATKAQDGRAATQYHGLDALRHALQAVEPIPAMTHRVQNVLTHAFMQSGRDVMTIPNDELGNWPTLLEAVNKQATLLVEVLQATVSEEKETTLAIELPETTDVGSLAEYVVDLAKFFEKFSGLPVGEGDQRIGSVALSGFDVGSQWLILDPGTVEALALIGWVVRCAMHLIDWGISKAGEIQLLKSMGEDTKSAVEMNQKLRVLYARRLAERTKEKTRSKADNEELNRIANMITECSDLLDRRFAFYPSRKALPAARDAFPPREPGKRSPDDLQLTGSTDDSKMLLSGEDEGEKPE